jgi:diphthamide biosynthesis enzyme Dph1/Dph2-like protein
MKTIYIPAKRKNLHFDKKVLDKLNIGNSIDILYTIQYENLAKEVANYFKNKKTRLQHVTGCSIIKSKNPLLIITDGKFHALNIAVNSNKEIVIFNGYTIEKITQEDLDKYNKIKNAKISKFLSSDEIGIIVSTKLYQNKLKEALILKEKLNKMGKKSYVFLCDNVNMNEIENFTLPIYINTACPGLDKDNYKILNYIDILGYLK